MNDGVSFRAGGKRGFSGCKRRKTERAHAMKTRSFLCFALAALVARPLAAAEPAAVLEPVDPEPGDWRFSVGFRAAPGVRTKAAVDARAAAAAAGLPTGPFSRTERLGSSTTGTTEADARAAAGYSPDATRWDFDNGYIDLDDGVGIEGETQNWHFDDASVLSGGEIRAERAYDSVTTERSRTTRTAATFPGEAAGALRDSSDETASGIELRLDRTLWEDADFGVDVGLGFAWYDDIDCLSIQGRAAAVRTTSTGQTATIRESGTVVTTLSEPEFAVVDDIRNADGSIGGGYVAGGSLPAGYRTHVLTVTPDRFSMRTERNPTETKISAAGAAGPSSSRAADVRSEGTLSLQELRLGVRPFWKVTRWLSLRGDVGFLAVYSELETETRLFRDGAPAATIRKDDDDWTFGGYAGLALDFAATDEWVFSVGAEARLPHEKLRFGDGVVAGSVELAGWSAFASVGWRF